MISFKHRFHGHNGLRFVYAHGKTLRSNFISLRFVENSKNSGYRAAVIVSKKVSKSAVVRNRIRRRIYEVIRKTSSEFVYPVDLVITVFHEDLATVDIKELEKEIHKLLLQAKIINKNQ